MHKLRVLGNLLSDLHNQLHDPLQKVVVEFHPTGIIVKIGSNNRQLFSWEDIRHSGQDLRPFEHLIHKANQSNLLPNYRCKRPVLGVYYE